MSASASAKSGARRGVPSGVNGGQPASVSAWPTTNLGREAGAEQHFEQRPCPLARRHRAPRPAASGAGSAGRLRVGKAGSTTATTVLQPHRVSRRRPRGPIPPRPIRAPARSGARSAAPSPACPPASRTSSPRVDITTAVPAPPPTAAPMAAPLPPPMMAPMIAPPAARDADLRGVLASWSPWPARGDRRRVRSPSRSSSSTRSAEAEREARASLHLAGARRRRSPCPCSGVPDGTTVQRRRSRRRAARSRARSLRRWLVSERDAPSSSVERRAPCLPAR